MVFKYFGPIDIIFVLIQESALEANIIATTRNKSAKLKRKFVWL